MKKIRNLVILFIIAIFCISPLFEFAKSGLIMSVYSFSESRKSLMAQEDITLKMPGGLHTKEKDWFPFVMTFNDYNGFSNYIGKPVKLSILYNFGAFEYLEGHSSYYNAESNYYNAFYGAYVTKTEDGFFGFNDDGTINYDEMGLIPEYDMRVLVLESIGCLNSQFEFTVTDFWTTEDFLGSSGWQVMDAEIKTNSPLHRYQKKYQAYIQYGKPPKDYKGNDFEEITVKGRVYAKAFPEKGVTIFFYVIAPNDEAIEACDQKFLKESKLEMN